MQSATLIANRQTIKNDSFVKWAFVRSLMNLSTVLHEMDNSTQLRINWQHTNFPFLLLLLLLLVSNVFEAVIAAEECSPLNTTYWANWANWIFQKAINYVYYLWCGLTHNSNENTVQQSHMLFFFFFLFSPSLCASFSTNSHDFKWMQIFFCSSSSS